MYELEVGIFSELPIQKSFDFLFPSCFSSIVAVAYRSLFLSLPLPRIVIRLEKGRVKIFREFSLPLRNRLLKF